MKWIRIDRPFSLPDYVKSAVNKLSEAGFVAYLVGGCVRDFLMNRSLKDYDLVTDADPDVVLKLFPNAVTVGKAFGVLKIPVPHSEQLLEIATFREDLEYKDFRHPTRVRFAGPVEDAHRRDFTVNALFFDPKTSQVLDVLDGLSDLKAKVLRAIGRPEDRFQEDALRLLRAIRFSIVLGFQIEEKTALAIQQRAKLITQISSERIRDELTMLWRSAHPQLALERLNDVGLLKSVLPELAAVKETVLPKRKGSTPSLSEMNPWSTTLKALKALSEQEPRRSIALSWAVVLQSVGKPVAFRKNSGKNFNNHELEGARLAAQIGDRFKLSRADCDRISLLVEDQLKCKEVFQMREATLQRFLKQPHIPELLALHRANVNASDGNLAYYEFCMSRRREWEAMPAMENLINGKDLLQLGFEPGPKFSEIIRVIEDLTLERKLSTKEQALEYVIAHFVR